MNEIREKLSFPLILKKFMSSEVGLQYLQYPKVLIFFTLLFIGTWLPSSELPHGSKMDAVAPSIMSPFQTGQSREK